MTTAVTKKCLTVESFVVSVKSPHTSEINCSSGRKDKEGLAVHRLHLTFKCSPLRSSSDSVPFQRRWQPPLPSKSMRKYPCSFQLWSFIYDYMSDGDVVKAPLDRKTFHRMVQSVHLSSSLVFPSFLPSWVWIRSHIWFREVNTNLFQKLRLTLRKLSEWKYS